MIIKADNKKIKNNFAFSLIELSIVILIISILASSGLTIFKSTNLSSKTNVTKDKIDTVYKALGNYLLTNRRLPCPASLELANSDPNYGNEVRISSACPTSGNFSGTGVVVSSNNNNFVYGMIPTKTLGLSGDMAEDGFGTKLSYIIDRRFGIAVDSSGTNGFEGSDGSNTATIIQIKDSSSSTILANAIMVIISHGSNKLGGFNSAGIVQNDTTGIAPDENENIRASAFDSIFVTSSSDPAFDDILIFKNKVQLAIDAGLESMLCRSAEANYSVTCNSVSATLTWNNANYGERKDSQVICPGGCSAPNPPNNNRSARTCEKYGIWGPLLYPCS